MTPGEPPLTPTAWIGLENTTLLGYVCITTDSADYYMLVNEWAWSKSRVCLLRLEIYMGSVLESELGHLGQMC